MPVSIKTHCLLFMLLVSCMQLNAQQNYNFDLEEFNKQTGKPLGWGGNVILPDTITKQSGKTSILLQKPGESFGAANYSLLSTFEGQNITLTGYVKTENVTDGYAGLWMRIDGKAGQMLELDNMGSRGIKGTTDWTKYTIELPHHAEDAYQIIFGGLITGTGKMWIDNFQMLADGKPINQAAAKKLVLLKAKTDTAFASGSGITSLPVTKQSLDNLTNLGMLWGFLKYHHPAIAKGDYNWDTELFRVLPNVLAAKNKQDANGVLEKWVDGLPKPDSCKTCKAIQKDSSTKLLPDYGYLFNKGNFSDRFIEKLTYIKNNRNQEKHFYVGMTNGVGNPEFSNENNYGSMTSPDAGYRLLALYRYWNMIQYFFPYKHLIGENWNQVLTEFIPVFAKANDATAYKLSCLRLIARVHDTHANIWGNHKELNDYYGQYAAILQTRFIENKLVVTGYYNDMNDISSKIKKGDIITKINNVKVEDLVKKFLPEIPASNYETQLRDLPGKLLRGQTEKVALEINHDGQLQTITVDRVEMNKLNRKIDRDPAPADSSYKLINNNIGYIFPGKYKNKQLPAIKELFKNTKGIVVDMRCYPSEFMPFTFGSYIKSTATPFVKFTGGSVSTPGLFTMGKELYNGGNSMAYNGKIVVIVNASTQSQAEYTTMAIQSAPNVTVIGSTTAGADGNVSSIYLPGNIFTYISGIGVYYPDGTETQRSGVRIDVPIKPTIKGIKEGRDELLEKAIAIIEGK
jgi:C-terminal processing protease CtpA/Prc